MKQTFFLLASLVINLTLLGQSLAPERVTKIKMATAQIFIEGSAIGSGFFIDKDGTLLTNYHVIAPAIVLDSLNRPLFRRIYVRLYNGDKIEFSIAMPPALQKASVAYDFCVLKPTRKEIRYYSFLKLGNFNDLNEGQEVVACGYPLGMPQQFLSKGIVSTVYRDTANSVVHSSGLSEVIPRDQALIDITLNPGNSGGPVIKIGRTIQEDEVIGIATFIKTQLSGRVDNIVNALRYGNASVSTNGISHNQALADILEVLAGSSVGISGCVSINHYLTTYNALKR